MMTVIIDMMMIHMIILILILALLLLLLNGVIRVFRPSLSSESFVRVDSSLAGCLPPLPPDRASVVDS